MTAMTITPDIMIRCDEEFEDRGRLAVRHFERASPKTMNSEIDGTVRIVRTAVVRRHEAIGRERPEAAGSKRPHLVYALRQA